MPEDIPFMAAKARTMVQESLDALVNADPLLARRVCSSDESLDKMRADVQMRLLDLIRDDPDDAEAWMEIRSVCRHLERLCDMATNVAEDVVYMIEGDIIRHGQGNL